MRLTPREISVRGVSVAVLAAGWTATALAWPDRELTRSAALTLGGCALIVAWLLRRGVSTRVSDVYVTFDDLVIIPLVLVYPAGWVMAVAVVAGVLDGWPSRRYRLRWYRAAFNAGALPLVVWVAALAALAAREAPGEGAVGVVFAAFAAAIVSTLLEDAIAVVMATIERGGRLAERYSVGELTSTLRRLTAVATFAVVVFQARAGDWPVLAAAILVLFVEALVSRATRIDDMAIGYEAERRQLLRLVVGAGDRQRREVTSHVHDGPLQVVLATRVLLDSMISRLEAGAAVDHDQLRALSGHLGGAIDDLRSTLREGYRDRLVVAGVRDGLAEVLRAHESSFARGYELSVDESIELSVETSVPLLLILREAIVNAALHSHASTVAVSVRAADGMVVGEVSDDGIGVDPAQISRQQRLGHLGIALMQERAERAGGTTAVERRETNGTRVCVRLPMSLPGGRPVEDWERAPAAQPGS